MLAVVSVYREKVRADGDGDDDADADSGLK